ncbi:MAG: glycosyltransferase, partial [Porphyromonas sp.]
MSKNYNEMLPVFEQGKCIPRLLHQTYKSKIVEDAALKSNIEHLKTLNPFWRYTLYDDADIEEFILRSYGKEIYAYYQRIEPCYGAAKADFFRYLLMYKCGGVYLDIKSTNDLPLDDVLLPDEQYILAHWDNLEGGMYVDHGRHPGLEKVSPQGEYQQWFIVAAP